VPGEVPQIQVMPARISRATHFAATRVFPGEKAGRRNKPPAQSTRISSIAFMAQGNHAAAAQANFRPARNLA